MTLKSKERSDIVEYRLERAIKTIKEVIDVGSLGYWALAANRLYYAAYYASAALLISAGIDATTHRGVIRMISSSYVKTGILHEEDSKLLGRLFTMRQSGDYEDLFDWEEKDVLPLIPQVKDYINRIQNIIEAATQTNQITTINYE